MLRGELTNLRAVDRHDADDIYRWLNNPDVMRFWGLPSSTPSLAEVQRQIEQWLDHESQLDRPACFIIETLEAEVIGFVSFGEIRCGNRSSELSLLIGEPAWWGKGIGTDVLQTVIATAFDDWNLRRLWARSEAFNERAQRLFKRCGFTHEATLRDASYFEDAYHDLLVFGLLASDQRGTD